MDFKTFTEQIAETLNREPEDVEVLISSLSNLIVNRVKEGDSVSIPAFGSFETKLRTERVVSHPSSGKKILVPPKLTFMFKPSALLRQKIRKS